MPALTATDRETPNPEPEVPEGSRAVQPSSKAAQWDRWRFVWAAALVVNGIFFTQVWVSTFSDQIGNNFRPILAAVFAMVGAYYTWRSNKSIAGEPSGRGILALVLSCLLLGATSVLHIVRVYLLANAALLLCFVWATSGFERARRFSRVAFLTFFMLPDLPEEYRSYLFIPLQHLSTFCAASLARLFVPIQVYNGHFFLVNGHRYDVAPGCSGLSMWAYFLFAFAIWQVFKKYRPAGYLVAFALDPVLTLTLNMVRLAITAIVGFYFSQAAALSIHTNLELGLVPIGLFILWHVGQRFEQTSTSKTNADASLLLSQTFAPKTGIVSQISSNSLLWKLTVTAILSLATIGSVSLAHCMTKAQVSTARPLQFPMQFAQWRVDERAKQTILPDAIARIYRSQSGETVAVAVRRNAANAVLHDLTSCLSALEAKPVTLREEVVPTAPAPLRTSLVRFERNNKTKLALLWFQSGTETASNRWSWRGLSMTSPTVRNAPYYSQGEVSLVATNDVDKDLQTLRQCAADVFKTLAQP